MKRTLTLLVVPVCLLATACSEDTPPTEETAGSGDTMGSGSGLVTLTDASTTGSGSDSSGTQSGTNGSSTASGSGSNSESNSGTATNGTTGGTASGTLTDPFGTESESTGIPTTGSSETGEPTCGEAMVVLEATPPNVMLVVDRSGSMVSNSWDHDLDGATPVITRWNSLYDVVNNITTNFDPTINFGLVNFPGPAATSAYSTQACVVDSNVTVALAPTNGAAVLAALPGPTSTNAVIRGGTPAEVGVTRAVEHLQSIAPQYPENEPFIVLITDGAANCSSSNPDCNQWMSGLDAKDTCPLLELYDENLPITVANASAAGIDTFVIGIDIADSVQGGGTQPNGVPEANAFQRLNDVADAGGRPRPGTEKFFNTTNEAELLAALEEVASQVISCTIRLDEPPNVPPRPNQRPYVSVTVGGVTYSEVMDCATENGFIFTNPELTELELCGAACDALKSDGQFDATYGCPPVG
jgi:hypothetical protein